MSPLAEKLGRDLEADMDWRFAELAALRIQALQAPATSTLLQALLRALVALLYAHYEGFCKQALRAYMDVVCHTKVKREMCTDEIKVFSLKNIFQGLRKDNSPDACWNFFKTLLPCALTEPIDFATNGGEFTLEGESNMYPEDLIKNLSNLSIQSSFVSPHMIRLKALVGRRNAIAHGKKLIIRQLSDYEEFEQAASDVMYSLALSLIQAVDTQNYLDSSMASTP